MQKIKIGTMLYQMRMEREVTREQLCQGLCQMSTMSYYENGERMPDSLLFHHFMQRLGVAPEDFAVMLSEKEYSYYLWKEKTLLAWRDKQWDDLDELVKENEAHQVKCNERIQAQYLYFLKAILALEKEMNGKEAVNYLKLAANQTMPDLDEIDKKKCLLGTSELEILMLYLYLGVKETILENHEAEQLFLMLERYVSDGILTPDERAKVYPKLICIWLNLRGESLAVSQRLVWCKKATDLLKDTGSLYDISELLRLYTENLNEIGAEEARVIGKQYKAIKEVLEQGGCDTAFRPEFFGGRSPKLYVVHEYLYSQRMIKQMTQERVSEGICEPESYSRIERGKRVPTVKNFNALAKRLDIGWGYYRGELVTDDLKVYKLRREQRTAVVQENWEEDKRLLAEMESRLDMGFAENKQYIEGKRNMAEFRLGNLTAEEVYQKDKALLQLTVKKQEDNVEICCYSQTEVELFAHMALMLRMQGKYEEGIRLLESVLKRVQSSSVDVMFRADGVDCVVRTLSGLYFANEEYQKSYELAEYDYKLNLKTCMAGALNWNLDAMADDLEHMSTKYRDVCKRMYEQAVYVSDFFELYNDSDVLKKYYEESFDKNKVWY